MSSITGSTHWSSIPDPVSSYPDPNNFTSEQIQRHALNTRDMYENASQSTGSSGHRKELSPFSDHGRNYLEKSPHYLPRTSSSISNDEHLSESMEPVEILRAVQHPSRLMVPRHHQRPNQLQFQFSQESDYNGQYGSSSTSLPFSQSTGHSGYHRSYRNGIYKPSSPSSSDNASTTSSVQNRLGSGPVSQASFSSISLSQSTSSSRSGYVYRLPRPSLTGSNPGSSTNLISTRRNPSKGELAQVDYNHQPMPRKGFSPNHESHMRIGDHRDTRRPNKRTDVKSERDSFTLKLDMVMSMMSALSSTSQSDADAAKLLLALSQSSETSTVLRQSMFINLILKILYNTEQKGSKEHGEIRIKAAEALHNIVEANSNTPQRRCERSVLSILGKVRSHCDMLFDFIASCRNQEPITSDQIQSLQMYCNNLMGLLRKLFKYSSEKELHRPAILNLGGLQAMAEVLIVDYKLPASQENKRIIRHSADTIAITITILINLTYGDVNNKLFLCNFPNFLPALMYHICSKDEQVMSKGAQVLRNLSCKATPDMKEGLLKCNAAVVLMEAVDNANSETAIQHITSALWNISAHSVENRHKLCRTQNGIETLVGLLSYNSPSGATVVIENVGGVLRNLSNVISQEEEYRRRFREAGGLAKLIQHLKSRNRTVLANATGILWNLSARCPDNQKLLWDMGSIPLLDVLQSCKQKNIAENARAALRNLLAFGHSNGWTTGIPTPPSVKSHRAHSKSTHSLNQTSNGDLISGRRSAPYTSNAYGHNSAHNSTSSLKTNDSRKSPDKNVLRTNIDKQSPRSTHSHHMVQYKGSEDSSGDDSFNRYSTPKFTRVLSAPQTSEEREEEWMNYRPKQESPEMAQKFHRGYIPSNPHPPPPQHKKKVTSSLNQMKMTNGSSSYPYSQTESLDSEFHSIGAVSLGLSPQLIMDGGGIKPSTSGEVTYHDLDIEIDDQLEDENQHSTHFRHPSAGSENSEQFSLADQFARDRDSVRRSEYIAPNSSSPNKLSPNLLQQHKGIFMDTSRTHGTSGLALDGTILSSEVLDMITESSDHTPSTRTDGIRSHSSSISSSTSKELSSDL